MPTFEVNAPDGKKYRVNAPDGATQDDAISYVKTNFYAGKQDAQQVEQPQKTQTTPAQSINDRLSKIEPPSWIEQQLAKLPSMSSLNENRLRGVILGGADFPIGAAQLAANAAGAVLPSSEKSLSDLVTGDDTSIAGRMNKAITGKIGEYEDQRNAVGRSGIDLFRMAGNIISPSNILTARALGPALSGMGMLGKGAINGAIGGAMQPVVGAKSTSDFAADKAGQVALGGIAGSLLAPVTDKAVRAIGNAVAKTSVSPADAATKAQQMIADAIKASGMSADDVSAAKMQDLTKQVADSLQAGKQLDVSAALRKADFQSVGIPALKGQITRDATQFAKERNLRGVANVGEPLQHVFDTQNQGLQGKIGLLADGAMDQKTAGDRIVGALNSFDGKLKSGVDDLYGKARDHIGRAAPMDHVQFSNAANFALDNEMLGSVLPQSARSILNDITTAKIPLNVNTAVQIDRTLSAIQRSGSQAEALAVGRVRDALNKTPIADNVGEDAKAMFDSARSAAKARFDMHDAIPSLKAAADGSLAPDDFVRKFVINGKVNDVQGMAKVLRESDPSAFQQARSQIGAEIQRAAFGENTAGDKIASPERLAKTLRTLGKDKLGAFFSPEEIDQMHTLSRVASYINSVPSNAPVNYSNTGGLVMNLLGRMPGAPAVFSIGNLAKNTVDNSRVVRSAVDAAVPATSVGPDDAVRGLLGRIAPATALVGGGLLGGALQ